MKMSPGIKKYKKTVSSLSISELLTVLNNSRLSKYERFVVELFDIYCKLTKVAAEIMKIYELSFTTKIYIKLTKYLLDDKDAPKHKALIYAKAMHK